jgi:hypothetical protein
MLSVDSALRPTVSDLMTLKIIKMRMKEKEMRTEYQKIKQRESEVAKKMDALKVKEANIAERMKLLLENEERAKQ